MKSVRIYLTSYGISGAILSALPVFLPLILLDRLSPAAYASLLVVSGVVQMILVPLLGTATDRYGSAHVLIIGEGLYLANLLFACACVWSGYSSLVLWAVFYAASGAIGALMMPAQATIVQSMVPDEKLPRYLGVEQAIAVSGRLVGPSVAGAWMVVAGPSVGFLAVVSAWLVVWMIHIVILYSMVMSEAVRKPDTAEVKGRLRAWGKEAFEGLLMRWKLRTERWLAFQTGIELLVIVPAFSMNLALTVKMLAWSNAWLGWLQASCGVGLVAANLTAEKMVDHLGAWRSAQLGGYTCAAAMLGCAVSVSLSNPLATCLCVLIANYSLGIRIYCGRAQRRVAIPKEYLGRFAASHVLINSLAAQFGNAIAAIVFSQFGAAAWYVMGSIGFVIVVALSSLIPDWRTLVSLKVDEARGYYARRHGNLLAPKTQE